MQNLNREHTSRNAHSVRAVIKLAPALALLAAVIGILTLLSALAPAGVKIAGIAASTLTLFNVDRMWASTKGILVPLASYYVDFGVVAIVAAIFVPLNYALCMGVVFGIYGFIKNLKRNKQRFLP